MRFSLQTNIRLAIQGKNYSHQINNLLSSTIPDILKEFGVRFNLILDNKDKNRFCSPVTTGVVRNKYKWKAIISSAPGKPGSNNTFFIACY